MITPEQIEGATGARPDRAVTWAPVLDAACREYDIDSRERLAAFLAQIGHESEGLHYTTELWGPTDAQRRYEVRQDLGNNQPGDGFRFRGRGLIQITGRDNYQKASDALGVDFVGSPELLAEPEWAARSAAHFWQSHGLNERADAGEFEQITKIINGGLNGYPNRLALYAKAKEVLS